MTTAVFRMSAFRSAHRWQIRVAFEPDSRGRTLRERWSAWLRAVPARPPRRAVPFVSPRLARLGAEEIAALPRVRERVARRMDLTARLGHI